jgi:DNA-binding XRE family transcriptional regulator
MIGVMADVAPIRDERDDLDELIEEFAREDSDLPRIVDALARARIMVRELARAREEVGMTQAQVAERIGTTQSAVARLERADVDPRLSTLVKYAAVVGRRVSVG